MRSQHTYVLITQVCAGQRIATQRRVCGLVVRLKPKAAVVLAARPLQGREKAAGGPRAEGEQARSGTHTTQVSVGQAAHMTQGHTGRRTTHREWWQRRQATRHVLHA
jgi:hypothetical protein